METQDQGQYNLQGNKNNNHFNGQVVNIDNSLQMRHEDKKQKNKDTESSKSHTQVMGMEMPENNRSHSHLNFQPKKLIKNGVKSILKVKKCTNKLNLKELYLFTPAEIKAVKLGITLYLELNTKRSKLNNN